MPQFLFVYTGGEYPSNPEEGQKHFERYQDWLMTLGQAVSNPAIPCKDTHTINSNGTITRGSISGMSGMSIIQLATIEDAIKVAQACPFLEIDGALEVSEMIDMPGDLDDGSKTIN